MTEHKGLSPQQVWYLQQHLDPSQTSTRSQGGTKLTYVESWAIIATLIRVFGYGGYSVEVTESKILRMDHDVPAIDFKTKKQKVDAENNPMFNWRVTATSTVRLQIHQTGAVYSETAAASQVGPDVGEVTDFAIKTASSDALKRCARFLGTQGGLSLYASSGGNVHYADVVGPIWAPDQMNHVKTYVDEAQRAAISAQQSYTPEPNVEQQAAPQQQGGHRRSAQMEQFEQVRDRMQAERDVAYGRVSPETIQRAQGGMKVDGD